MIESYIEGSYLCKQTRCKARVASGGSGGCGGDSGGNGWHGDGIGSDVGRLAVEIYMPSSSSSAVAVVAVVVVVTVVEGDVCAGGGQAIPDRSCLLSRRQSSLGGCDAVVL